MENRPGQMSFTCGLFGTLSKIWERITGHVPPFEICCQEHDLAYSQIETAEDRAWADANFLRCVRIHGYPRLGYFLWLIVRLFGWTSRIVQKLRSGLSLIASGGLKWRILSRFSRK